MKLIVLLNNIFRRPGVEGRESPDAYSAWEYRTGRQLVDGYLGPAGDLLGKRVLDIGCGRGGKSLAYGEAGARTIIGVDLSTDFAEDSVRYMAGAPRRFGWGFVVADAARLPAAAGTFDTVVANDAMEHFAEPEAALAEMARVIRPGGAIWIFFTPHFSPLGSHLYDYIYTPWCHLLFRRGQIRSAVREILKRREPRRALPEIDARVGRIMNSFDGDLNHMSVRRFLRIVRCHSELRVSVCEFKPAKFGLLKVLTWIPLVRELFTGTVVCRLERTE